jgi:hypothetical protein
MSSPESAGEVPDSSFRSPLLSRFHNVEIDHELQRPQAEQNLAVIEEARHASPPWQPYVFATIEGQAGRSPSKRCENWLHPHEVKERISTLASMSAA